MDDRKNSSFKTRTVTAGNSKTPKVTVTESKSVWH
jgi:hypothetical protein